MAELFAQGPTPDQQSRISLNPNTKVRLGRAPQDGWGIPWDDLISREHADIHFQNDLLKVTCLPTARNPIRYQGVEDSAFTLHIGEKFQIGGTVFHLHGGGSTISENEQVEFESFTTNEIRNFKIHNPEKRLDVLSKLPQLISLEGTQADFVKNLSTLLLQAIPNADATAVIVGLEEGDNLAESILSINFQDKEYRASVATSEKFHHKQEIPFRPSSRLIQTALETGESQLHEWSEEDSSSIQYTLTGDLNWAFCIPIQAEACKGWCLYVSGMNQGNAFLETNTPNETLLGDLRLAELIGQILGSILQVRLLEERQTRMNRYFSPKVVRTMSNKRSEELLAPREGDITVLFCDLRGFSRHSEKEQHNLFTLLERVSQALGVMTRGIVQHEGVIADFQGDAALGFWGWPIPPEDGPLAACRTALEIHKEFTTAAQDETARLAGFRVGIGIAHGTAITGRIGTVDQEKVGVFGPVVNLAARLEQMTKQLRVPILIDETVAEYVRNHMSSDEGRCRRLGRIQPFGLANSFIVSELLPTEQSGSILPDAHLVDYERAVDLFQEGRWVETLEMLDRLPVGERAKDFLMIYIAQNNYEPPANWDGVITMQSK